MAASRWADGLTVAGLYYDGVIDEKRLQDTLELHKRDTVSTFGTRSSRRVEKDKHHHGPNNPLNPDTTSFTAEKENIDPYTSVQGKLQVNLWGLFKVAVEIRIISSGHKHKKNYFYFDTEMSQALLEAQSW